MPSLEYEHENVLKKVHVGNTDYYFKDEDLRNSVENFGTAVNKDAVETLDSSGTDLPTEAAVADYIDDFKTNEVDPKVSVALGNDEELIFNYVIASSGEEYTVSFNVSDVHFGSNLIHITESHNPFEIYLTSGDNILEHVMDPEFVVYDENSNLVSNHNFVFTGWCTDPSNPSTTEVGQNDTISSNMTLYPIFSQILIG